MHKPLANDFEFFQLKIATLAYFIISLFSIKSIIYLTFYENFPNEQEEREIEKTVKSVESHTCGFSTFTQSTDILETLKYSQFSLWGERGKHWILNQQIPTLCYSFLSQNTLRFTYMLKS